MKEGLFRDARGVSLAHSLWLSNETSIYVGIDVYGHAYIVVGDTRFDGHPMGLKPRILKSRALLTEGAVVRIADPRGDLSRAIIAYLDEVIVRSGTCVSAICDVLNRSGGLNQNSHLRTVYSPEALFLELLDREVQGLDGMPLKKEIFLLGKQRWSDLQSTWQGIASGVKTGVAISSAFGGWLSYLAIAQLIEALSLIHH